MDNLGEGVTTIAIQGNTAYRLGGSYPIGFGYAAYQMLRQLVNRYNDDCKQGKTAQTELILTIEFPDAKEFGSWKVTVQELKLQRSAAQPLLFRYSLTFLCLSTDLLSKNRQFIDLGKLKIPSIGKTKVVPPPAGSAASSAATALEGAQKVFGVYGFIYLIPGTSEVSAGRPNTISTIASRFMQFASTDMAQRISLLRSMNTTLSSFGDTESITPNLIITVPNPNIAVIFSDTTSGVSRNPDQKITQGEDKSLSDFAPVNQPNNKFSSTI